MKKNLFFLIISIVLVILLIRCGSNGRPKNSLLDQENIDGKIKIAKLIGNEIAISTADDDQQNPHIINLPDKKLYFVVWEDYRNRNATGSDIYGQFVNYSGRLCGSAFPVYSSIGNQTVPWLAYRDGGVQAVSTNTDDKIVVVWQDEIGGNGGGYVGIREINVNNLTKANCDNIDAGGTTIISKGAVKYPRFSDGKMYRFQDALETIGIGDGSTTSFSKNLSYFPLYSSLSSGNIKITAGTIVGNDNGNGTITGTGISSGSINYSTGLLNITFAQPPKKFEKIVVEYKYSTLKTGTPKTFNNLSGITELSGSVTTGETPVKPTTFSVILNGTSYASDNGKGTIGIDKGTINYTTGSFIIKFQQPLPKGSSITINYDYYSQYPITFTEKGTNLLSRKFPKISYDNVKDTFKLTWVETRDKTNYISVLAFGHTPVNWSFGDQNSIGYLTIDAVTLNEKTNLLNVNGPDLFRNSESSLSRIIASSSTNLSEKYELEFFNEANNPVTASDTTTPETFFAFEGKRLKGSLDISCDDLNNNDTCNFWESVSSTFANEKYDDGFNHIYGFFEKEITVSILQAKKVDTSENSDSYKPAITFDPITKKFLIAWEDTREDSYNSNGNTKIYGRLIYSGAGFYNTDFLIGYQDTDNDGNQDDNVKNSKQSKPYISYDSVNQRFFVIWQDGRNGNISFENLDIMGQYIDLEGSRRGNNYFISTSPGNQLEPKIAYNHDKNEFLAIWKDARSFLGFGASDIYGQRYSLGNPALFLLTLDNKPFSPPLLDFGSVTTGQYATLSFKVKNVGDTTLKIDYVSPPTFTNFTSTTFTHISLPSQLSAKDDNLTLDLVPGAETTLTVKFEPQNEGSFKSSFNILSDGGNATVNLFGKSVSPKLTVDTNNLNFGDVKVNQSSSLTFKITNNGNQEYNITNVSGFAEPFSISPMPTGLLKPGESKSVTVTFKPTLSGSFTSQINIQTDITNLSQTISLSGSGVAPLLTVSTLNLDFGSVAVNDTKDLTLRLSNVGTSDITQLSLTLNGNGFSIYSSVSAPITKGNYKDIILRFAPQDNVNHSATLNITTDGGNAVVNLKGTGTAPKITLIPDPSSLDFGTIATGSSKTLALSIKNSGNSILTVNGIGSLTSPFNFVFTPTFPVTLLPNSSYNITIKFNPTSAGSYSKSLTVTSDAVNGTPTILLQGIAADPSVNPAPGDTQSITFSSIGVNSTETKSFIIQNTGQIDVKILNFDNPTGPFTILNLPQTPYVLASGSTLVLQARFNPTQKGTFNSALKILYEHEPLNPAQVSFTGTAVEEGTATGPYILLTPPYIDFGNIQAGKKVTKVITVANTGNAFLNISSITEPGNKFGIDYVGKPASSSNKIQIMPNTSKYIFVNFSSTTQGNYNANFKIYSDALNGTQTINLQATTHGNPYQYVITASTFENFSSVRVGATSTRVYKITNTGTFDLEIVNRDGPSVPFEVVFGSSPSALSGEGGIIPTFTPQVIKPGEDLYFMIRFSPSASTVYTSSLTISFKEGVSPYTINLRGKGVEPVLAMWDELQYGAITANNEKKLPVRIYNLGSYELEVTKVFINTAKYTGQEVGYPENAFQIYSGITNIPFKIAPNSYIDVGVKFKPSARGDYEAELMVMSDAGNDTTKLTGQGVGGKAVYSVTSVDFGATAVGRSVTKIITITNEGSAPLTITGVTAPTNTSFTINDATLTGLQLAPNGSYNIIVTYTPTVATTDSDTFTVTTDDPLNATQTISLSGSGVTPALTITEGDGTNNKTLNFGGVLVGGMKDYKLTLENTSKVAYNITRVFGIREPFSIVENIEYPKLLNAGEKLTLTIKFISTQKGTYNVPIEIDTDAGITEVITLSGTSQQAVARYDRTVLDFGGVMVNENKILGLTIKNVGDADLKISEPVLPVGFSLYSTVFSNLSSMESRVIRVKFSPKELKEYSGKINIETNVGDQEITLRGQGVGGKAVYSVTSVDFGATAVGRSVTKIITITNEGSAPLTITGVTAPTNTKFTINDATLTGLQLAPNGSYNIIVTYTPTVATTDSGSFTVTTDDPLNATQAINLSGSGVTPALTITEGDGTNNKTLNFGGVIAGSAKDLQLTLENTSGVAYNITGVSGAVAPYSIVENVTYPKLLNAGEKLILTVRFNPTVKGSYNIPLKIDTDAGITEVITLSGTSQQAVARYDRTVLDFGGVTVNSTKDIDIVITNSGDADLEITMPSGLPAGFSVQGLSLATVRAGGTSTLKIRFSPTELKSYSGTFNIETNVGTQSITVTGQGIGGKAVYSVTSLDFGSVAVGRSKSDAVTIKNEGSALLTIKSLSINGGVGGYSLGDPNIGGLQIAPGGSYNVLVIFSPISSIQYNRSLEVVTDDPLNATQAISLSGTGVTPALTITEGDGTNNKTLDFGGVLVGGMKDYKLTLENTSKVAYNITRVFGIREPFSIVENIEYPKLLNAGEKLTLTIKFISTQKGTYNVPIEIDTDAGITEVITLSGTSQQAVARYDTTVLDFGSVLVGNNTTATLKIYNEGDDTLTITQPTAYPAGFSFVSLTSTSVTPGSSVTLTLRFSPTVAKPYTGTIDIVTNVGTQTITLTGTGISGQMTVDKTSIDFGTVVEGTTTAWKSVTITNNGDSSLTINSITDPTDSTFKFVNKPASAFTIPVGGSYTLQIYYSAPSINVAFSSNIGSFTINSSSGSQTILLQAICVSDTSGLGDTPTTKFTVTPLSVDFDKVVVNTQSQEKTVTITASAQITINSISAPTDSSFEIINPPSGGHVLDGGSSYTLRIVYKPTALGSNSAIFSINTSEGTKIVSLQGYAVTAIESGTGTTGGTTTTGTTVTVQPGKSACFIATAAYGSYLDPNVVVLREFRDKYLLTNTVGRAFVEFYYRTSPPIADFIREHNVLRVMVRIILTPIVYTIKFADKVGLTLLIFGVVIVIRRKF